MKKIIKILLASIVLFLIMGCVSAQDNETATLNALNDNNESLDASNNGEIGISYVENTSQSENALTLEDNQQFEISSAGSVGNSWSVGDRTFKIGKYKVVLTQDQMENWVDAKNIDSYAKYGYYPEGTEFVGGLISYGESGIGGTLIKYTGKTIKQKVGVGLKCHKDLTIKMPKTIKSYKKAEKWVDYYIKKVKKIRGKVGYVNIYKKKGNYYLAWYKPIFKKFKTVNAKVCIVLNYGICRYPAQNRAYNMFLTTNYQLKSNTFYGTYLENNYRESQSLMGLKR